MLRAALHIGSTPLIRGAKLVLNRFRPPVLILLYHRVTTLESDPQLLSVTPANFRAHLKHLKENFCVAGLEEDWSRMRKPAVVVTFDDGYADNALEALPILEELQVPATFFVSTSLIGSDREFWWDEAERLLLCRREYPPSFECSLGGKSWRRATAHASERLRLYHEILPILRSLAPETRGELLERLRLWSGASAPGRATHRVLSEEELRRLAASPLAALGAHTVSHSSLSVLPAARQREEVVGSKQWLEDVTGEPVTVFSYPFGGKADYTAETVAICRQTGFTRTCSNFPGQWRGETDLHQLPRHLVRNWDLETFKSQLSRFWNL